MARRVPASCEPDHAQIVRQRTSPPHASVKARTFDPRLWLRIDAPYAEGVREKRSLAPVTGEVVAPFPCDRADVPRATQYKTTWIISSLESLRSLGHFDRYHAALRAIEARRGIACEQELLSCVAGQWLTMAIARAHYEACDTLGLDERAQLHMAIEGDGGQVRRAWHAQIVNAAQKESASPWNILPQLPKLWLRSADGGAAAVYRQGDNQAVVEYVGCELFDVRYYRGAVRAVLYILSDHMCEELTVTTLPQAEPGQTAFQLRWRLPPR